ncbi:MAG: rhomboid family intramembrane serine protease, partial [Clostridiales bacterium]
NDQLYSELVLQRNLVLEYRQVWRLITFIFIPPNFSPIFALFALALYYFIGSSLENEWGTFKFNLYYFIGVIGTALSAFLSSGIVDSKYIYLSLFLAFAYLYPDFQIRLFLILPIKMKYLAWLDVVFLAFSFFGGNLTTKISISVSLINFLLFFGMDIFRFLTNRGSSKYRKMVYTSQTAKNKPFHKCHVCGITEEDDYNAEFRFCGSCEGNYEYCMKHLKSHEHIKK